MGDKRVDIVFELINRQQFVDDLERDEFYPVVSSIIFYYNAGNKTID